MKKTARSLLLSGISLLLCFAMLVGTTFAWFTDSVSSGNNIIVAGNLDVEMYWTKDLTSGNWIDAEDPKAEPIFNNTLWEPGYTEVRYIKIVNAGGLAFKYGLSIIPDGEVSILADVIDVYYVENATENIKGREDLAGMTAKGTLRDAIAGSIPVNGVILPKGKTPANNEYVGDVIIAIALKMDEKAGNEYMNKSIGDSFSIQIVATQYDAESDSFGSDYDNGLQLPTPEVNTTVRVPVTPDENGKVPAGGATLDGGNVGAYVPEGVLLEDGVTELTLSVSNLENSNANLTLGDDENQFSLDVHVGGISKNNTVPIQVALGEVAPKGLNIGNLSLYHVEDGTTANMTRVGTNEEFTAHNQYKYDPATGEVIVNMATFSEVALVAEPSKWEGKRDYSWYVANATEFIIANADQLAGFGAIVGGMDGKTQDSFTGKTVKLVADIKIGDTSEYYTDPSENGIVFYPIGYWNNEGTYEKLPVEQRVNAVESGFYSFEGTFDGNGHTISDWYQNTWEMKGDHNWYDPIKEQYYRDGMGLFGKIYKGTVKNLTVKNFSSDGEITTTGTIAAYAEGATFENIAIFNCNPRVYNIGNGGIVGCVGWYAKEAGLKTTFKNITVDNTNKISALWGSWDVACGGIVGQYYPTSGQTSAGTPKNAGIEFVNCHVAAQIDVYNDVCANYQYYAYRYAGILMGSVRENVIGEDGHEYPDMTGITASGCTVHFGDWNDYYYCELVANSLASYTHDHQMSRLEQVEKLDANAKKYLPLGAEDKAENWVNIPSEGRQNYVVVNGKTADGKWDHGDGKATCYHFVNGVQHKHDVADSDNPNVYETVDGQQVLVEDKQCVYREFNNLITGYGWGVTSKGVEDMDGVTILDREEGTSVEKFTGNGVAEIESNTAIKLSDLFNFVSNGVELKLDGLSVTVTDLNDADGIATGTFKKGATWEDSTITVNGKGAIAITIQDYYFCAPTTITLTAVDPMVSITVDATMLYSVGQELNINSITVNYKSGNTKILSADDYTLSAYDMSFGGKKTIAVSYTELGYTITQTFIITVSEEFSNIIASSDKSIYFIGETPKFTVNAIAADGTKGEVKGFTVSGADTSSAGIKKVTISYANKTTTCTINVINTTIIDSHKLWNFDTNGFYLGSSQQYYIYNHYLTSAFPGGANGEMAVGFNNTPAGGAENPDSPSGIEYYLGASQYDLKITGALPYTTVGIGCVAVYDEIPLGFGYYIGDDLSTLNYTAPTVFVDEVAAGNKAYEGLVNAYSELGVSANVKLTLNGFVPGDTYEIHWVVVFDDGIQSLADWTVKMKSSVSDDYFENTDKPDINVIVLSGQSNAAGATPITPEMAEKFGAINYANVYMQYKNVYTNDGVNVYTQNQNNNFEKYYFGMGGYQTTTFGPDAALAYYLATTDGLKDQQWFIIKYAAPGTNLDIHWLQNANLADLMINYVQDCIDELSKDYDVQLRSFLWMQGENDALAESCANKYAANEQALVAKFRAKFSKYDATKPNYMIAGSGIAFISAGIAPYRKDGNEWIYSDVVNAAKVNNAYVWYAPGQTIPENSPLYNKEGAEPGMSHNPNAAGIYNSAFIDTSLMSAQVTDAAHYDQQSMNWLGTWFGEYVITMMNIQLPAPPPPKADTYTVFLDANGGVIGSNMLETAVGGSVTLPTPTRNGYYFDGWYDANGNKVDASYTPTGNVMLTAKWYNRIITVENNISGVTVSGVYNNQLVNAGDIINVTVTNNNSRPVIFDIYDATNNILLYREVVAIGATSVTVPYAMGTNVSVVISNAYMVTVNNNASNVTVTGVQNNQGVAAGTDIVATIQNNSGKQIKFAFVNETTGEAIWVSTVEAGATQDIPYGMNCDVSLTIYEQYTITVQNSASPNITVSGITNGQTEYAGEEITFTIKNTSSAKTVTVTDSYGNTLYSNRLSRNASATLTLTMKAEDVTITIK